MAIGLFSLVILSDHDRHAKLLTRWVARSEVQKRCGVLVPTLRRPNRAPVFRPIRVAGVLTPRPRQRHRSGTNVAAAPDLHSLRVRCFCPSVSYTLTMPRRPLRLKSHVAECLQDERENCSAAVRCLQAPRGSKRWPVPWTWIHKNLSGQLEVPSLGRSFPRFGQTWLHAVRALDGGRPTAGTIPPNLFPDPRRQHGRRRLAALNCCLVVASNPGGRTCLGDSTRRRL